MCGLQDLEEELQEAGRERPGNRKVRSDRGRQNTGPGLRSLGRTMPTRKACAGSDLLWPQASG